MSHQVIIKHRFYKSEVVIDGWLVVTFRGVFHRHYATQSVDECMLKAELICIQEKVHDEENVKFIG
jgi:hypothetical protein